MRRWNFSYNLIHALIVGSALSVNKIRILFRKKKTILNQILTNPYRSGRRLVPVSLSDWPDILRNWSVIFSGQSMEDTIPDMEFGTTQYAYFVSV